MYEKRSTLEVEENIYKEPPYNLSAQNINIMPTSFKLQEESFFTRDDFVLNETFLSRSFSNTQVENSKPYFFALGELVYAHGNHEVDFGFTIYNGYSEHSAEVNQASYSYFGDSCDFKVGKYVATVGVLDYMSSVNMINPTRGEFFDETNINIRRIPLWMSEFTYYPSESIKFKAIVQTFDKKYQDYTSIYLSFILDAYLPNYFKSLSANNTNLNSINEEVFMPVYNESISPTLNKYIQSKYSPGSATDIDKAGFVLVSEYSAESANYGAVWMNRYSEIPLVKVNQDILNIVNAGQNDTDIAQSLENYLNSDSNDLISSVDGYRYNQYSLYYEGTADKFGLRVEGSFRDKLPTVNEFSWLSSLGLGVDYQAQSIYNNLELQWLHLETLQEDMFAGILSTRFDTLTFSNFELLFEHYLLFGYYNSIFEVSTLPSITMKYENVSVVLQYLASKEQRELNSASVLFKVIF